MEENKNTPEKETKSPRKNSNKLLEIFKSKTNIISFIVIFLVIAFFLFYFNIGNTNYVERFFHKAESHFGDKVK